MRQLLQYFLVDTWMMSLDLNIYQQHFDPYTRGAVRRGEAEGVVEGVSGEVDHEVIPPSRCLIVTSMASRVRRG